MPGKTVRLRRIAVFGALAFMLAQLAGCAKKYDTEIRGEVTVAMGLGSFSAEGGRHFGGSTVMLEYEPDHYAVLYTSEKTKLVGLESQGNIITWQLGRDYLVRGKKTQPMGAEEVDGKLIITSIEGTEMWLDAVYIELLDETAATEN